MAHELEAWWNGLSLPEQEAEYSAEAGKLWTELTATAQDALRSAHPDMEKP